MDNKASGVVLDIGQPGAVVHAHPLDVLASGAHRRMRSAFVMTLPQGSVITLCDACAARRATYDYDGHSPERPVQ